MIRIPLQGSRKRIPLFVVFALAVAGSVSASSMPDQAFEHAGMEREARLDYDGAFDAYQDALRAAVDAATGKARDARFAAAEVYVFKLAFLAERTARWVDLRATLERARRARLPPLLDARCAWYLIRCHMAADDVSGAEAIAHPLGFLTRFVIAGPFDNERGGGFAIAYAPEKGSIDLKARYPGKGREVGWVEPSREAFLGTVNLDALLRPNDQTLAYALTYVRWEKDPQAAALRLGTDEGVRAWWNDKLVLSRDVNRTLEFDQDATCVMLRRGWNRLLLKVTERTGPWAFMVRLTKPDGAPLDDLIAVEPRVAMTEPFAGRPSAEPSEPRSPQGAVDYYEALEKAGKATARDEFHLGYLYLRRNSHDENAHPDREAFLRAVAMDETNAVYHAYLALVSAATGEYSVNREENKKRAELERCIALDPSHARAALVLAEYYGRSLRNVDKATGFLERALEVAPTSIEARLLEAEFEGRRVSSGRACQLLFRLAKDARALRSPNALARLAEARRAIGDVAGAERDLASALRFDAASSSVRKQLIDVRLARGEVAGALELLQGQSRLDPFDLRAHVARAEILKGQDRLDEALLALEQALEISPSDDAVLADHGKLLLRLGRRKAALEEFSKALALNPELVDLRRYVEFLRSEERPFEDEYRLDPNEAIAAAKRTPVDPGQPVRILLENSVSKVHVDGTSSQYEQRVLRIENDDGVTEYDSYAVPFAVGEQKVTFKRASVVKADGRILEARIENGVDERATGEFTTFSNRSVNLPSLEVGDCVVIEYRLDDLKESFFGDYFGHTHYFQGLEPLDRSRYTLIVPSGRPFYFNAHKLGMEPTRTVSSDGSLVTYVWEARHVPRIEQEPRMPPMDEVAPQIQVSTFKDWNVFARWYWNLVRKQQEASDEMRAKVQEITAGKPTRADKVRAIYDFVVTDVRYNGDWEFGVHGFKPYNAASIFTRRFGDCKDKATLIITMLSTIGIEAYPVLIDAQTERGEEDLSLPLMTHFNHCIAYVPGPTPDGRDGWFLDGTAQHHEATNLPNMDFGATVLIVKPDGAEIRRVRWPDALNENGMREHHRVAVKPDGGAEFLSEYTPSGLYSVVIRGQFENVGERKTVLENAYGRHFAGAAVEEATFSELGNLEQPVIVRFRMSVPRFVKQTAGGFSLEEVPSVLFQSLYTESMSDFASKSERKYDIVLPMPSGLEETTEYSIPERFSVKSTPPDVRLDTEFGSYEKRYELNGRALRVTRRLVVKTQRIPAAKYQAWRDFANKIDRAEDERTSLGKEGPQE